MNYEPWTRTQPLKPIAFITDANASGMEITDESGAKRYRTVKGTESRLEKLHGTVLYSLVKPKQLILFGGAQNWTLFKYHGRPVRLTYKGVSIYSWADFGPDPQELIPFFDALRELNIGAASLTTMAKNSWLALIPRTYRIMEWGSGPKIGRAAFIGGRKEALQPTPATYSGVKYLDLPAAYLSAMSGPIPLVISERSEHGARWCDEGICQAIVEIPKSNWNPLPFRLSRGERGFDLEVFAHGPARGIFVISELRNAVENHGVKVELERVWRGAKYREPFAEWLPWAYELRKLPGMAGVVAKQMTTRLWSMFGQNPTAHKKERVTFEDRKGFRKIVTEIPSGSHPRVASTAFVPAIIAARVRVRLLEELIPVGAVQVDTDGGIVPSTAYVPGWAEKRRMDTVEVKSSQAYRWQCPDCPTCPGRHPTSPWHYSVAGAPTHDPILPLLFEHHAANQLLRMRSEMAIAIPTQTIAEAKRWIADQKIEAVPDETL